MSRTRSLIPLCVAVLLLAATSGLANEFPNIHVLPQQSASVVVAVVPNEVSVPVGNTTDLHVEVEDPVDLYAFDIRLAFEPSVIHISDADLTTPGVQVQIGSLFGERIHFVATNRVDNTAGTIHVAALLVGDDPINVSGDLIKMTVTGEVQGISPLSFTDVQLADNQVNRLPAALFDGTVIVGGGASPTPTPTDTTTATPSTTVTHTPSATATGTASASPTPSLTVPSTSTPSATSTATAESTTTVSPSPSATSTATVTLSPTPEATAEPSVTPSATPTSTATLTSTPSTTVTPTVTSTMSPTPTVEPTVTLTATPTATSMPARYRLHLPLVLNNHQAVGVASRTHR